MWGPCTSLEHWSPPAEAEIPSQMLRGLPSGCGVQTRPPDQQSGTASQTEVTVELGQKHATQSRVVEGEALKLEGLACAKG